MQLKMNSIYLRILVFGLLCLVQSAHGRLVFEQEKLSLKAEPGQAKLEAVFKFVNGGTEPVTVTKVKPTCGCTITNFKEEKTFQPGESGEIRSDFTVGSRRGTKDVTIAVQTAENVNYRLSLSVEIPTVLEIKPKVLTWKLDDLGAEQTTDVIIHSPDAYTLKAPESFPEGVSYNVEEVEPGVFTYRFKLPETIGKGVHKLPFLAVAEDGSALSEQLFLLVR